MLALLVDNHWDVGVHSLGLWCTYITTRVYIYWKSGCASIGNKTFICWDQWCALTGVNGGNLEASAEKLNIFGLEHI